MRLRLGLQAPWGSWQIGHGSLCYLIYPLTLPDLLDSCCHLAGTVQPSLSWRCPGSWHTPPPNQTHRIQKFLDHLCPMQHCSHWSPPWAFSGRVCCPGSSQLPSSYTIISVLKPQKAQAASPCYTPSLLHVTGGQNTRLGEKNGGVQSREEMPSFHVSTSLVGKRWSY